MHIYDHISLNASYNKKYFKKKLEKTQTHISCRITVVFETCHLWDSVEKYGSAGQATGGNMAHMFCTLDA
jgi:hypothetical protein